MILHKNTIAPFFCLKDKDGKEHCLKKINSNFIVIYFYPRDNTPGCTIEANQFNKHLKEFQEIDTTIIGVSGGDEKTKTKFCEKNKLNLILLSDHDFEVSNNYGVYGEKSFMGKKFNGIKRITFVLDRNKKIINVYNKVKPFTHAEEVLKYIKDKNGDLLEVK